MSDQIDAKKAKRRKWYIFYSIVFWVIALGLISAPYGIFYLTAQGFFGELPTFEELENPRSSIASEVYSSDNYLLGKYYSKNRTPIDYNEISPNVVNALVATEDIRFYEHSGIDWLALPRIVIKNVFAGDRNAGGGSTITQQLAKNLFHESPGNILGRIKQKLKEWVISVQLERSYTKTEILQMYLNTVPFSGHSFGIKAAAKTFFNKLPSELKVEEAAVWVGMLKANTRYNPLRNSEKSKHRRNVVLNQMVKYNYLEEEVYDSIKTEHIVLDYQVEDHNIGLATYFREMLRDYLKEWCRNHKKENGEPYNLYRDGLKIYTTLDSRMQRYAEDAVKEHLTVLQKQFFKHWEGRSNAPFWRLTDEEIDDILRKGMVNSERYRLLRLRKVPRDSIELIFDTPTEMKVFSWKGEIDTVMTPMDSVRYAKFFLQTGFMSMEPKSGHIKAWVGGINHRHFKYDHVMKGKRQVGSTFKPFVYTVAIDNGYSPCTPIPNMPITFIDDLGNKWTPENADDEFDGQILPMNFGLANSINVMTAQVLKNYTGGAHSVVELAQRMGITSHMDPYPSICLGTFDISVYEMVGAYSTFANKGIWTEPQFLLRIEDKSGNIIEQFHPKTREAMSEQTAYLMTQALRGVVDGVYNKYTDKRTGTGVRVRFRYQIKGEIGGKTGTTQNNSDGWFVGFTPELVSGVWTGCEDRSAHFRSTYLGQGANMALPIWALYMKKVYADSTLPYSPEARFEPPSEPITLQVDCGKYEKSDLDKLYPY